MGQRPVTQTLQPSTAQQPREDTYRETSWSSSIALMTPGATLAKSQARYTQHALSGVPSCAGGCASLVPQSITENVWARAGPATWLHTAWSPHGLSRLECRRCGAPGTQGASTPGGGPGRPEHLQVTAAAHSGAGTRLGPWLTPR